ncbi:potassium channel family protein [Micromonospora sp. CPCC 205371]|nr:potassium channel family protein [Micromonospora sp. CPCC 205371]
MRDALGRPLLTGALIVGLYYLVPVEPGVGTTLMLVRALATVVVGILITRMIVRQVRRSLSHPGEGSLAGLLTAIVGGVAFFALADYITAMSSSGQFVGLATKTDALYFALATLTTVGYGDIHAAGQLARAVVAAQLVFNVVIIATGASVLTRELASRARNHP